jgi:ribose 5-phosphate isomerase B
VYPSFYYYFCKTKINTSNLITVEVKTIGLASDHAGYELKQFVKEYLTKKGYTFKDFGTNSTDSCDYPDFAHPLAEAVERGECYPGIAICGSGEGIAITLNKHQGIRAALSWIPEIAHLARQHNNANVLVMPGRFIDTKTAEAIMDEYFSTEFEGGRHQNRIDKIPVKK